MRRTISPGGSDKLPEEAGKLRHDANDSQHTTNRPDRAEQEDHKLDQSLSLEDARKNLETRDAQESVQNLLENLKPDIQTDSSDAPSKDDTPSLLGEKRNDGNVSRVATLYSSAPEGRRAVIDSVRTKVHHMKQFFGMD